MKQALPNLAKLLGALGITTAVFFLVLPEAEVNDEVFNASLEFLGNRLLAMAPKEQQPQVQEAFNEFYEQAKEGKVSEEHVETLAITILNAEAEGKSLEEKQIDSLLTALRVTAAKQRANAKKLRALGERLQAYRHFEERWHRIMPEAPAVPQVQPPPPIFRVAPNGVVVIDSAAFAKMAVEHAKHFAAQFPAAMVGGGPDVNIIFKEFSQEFPGLKVEMRKSQWYRQNPDSMKKMIYQYQFEQHRKQSEFYTKMADSLKEAARRYKIEFQREMPPPPPPPPQKVKPEEQKKPE
ncbi:MAG: hypothetical protein ONA90_06230 [candidate division KSB1 bacterium]|nr:hypothetical protein [candidate division KSB1 bacterium]